MNIRIIMSHTKSITTYILGFLFLVSVFSCQQETPATVPDKEPETDQSDQIVVSMNSQIDSSGTFKSISLEGGEQLLGSTAPGQWLAFNVNVSIAGRYKTIIEASTLDDEAAIVWVEDYYKNTDGRTYNITGDITVKQSANVENTQASSRDGSPLNTGTHPIKIHFKQAGIFIKSLTFKLIKEHQLTPTTYTQKMDGTEWKIVWSDEFEGTGLPDTSKWVFDIGDWGWGNNELQYYTENRTENARQENGFLIIEARKDDLGNKWTSTRLTTRGKETFLYGKIEFKAKVPREKGNWAAGWTLGDSYVDEISWPYCGEIDILESVGYEVDNETGNGIAHCTVHTPAYYFKINNQISSTKNITDIAGKFHTYSVEWTPTEVKGFVDGEQYYLYDKIANEKEWPFAQPQNIILNLAMGGGWGGAQGMDETVTSQQFVIDYVRVYDRVD